VRQCPCHRHCCCSLDARKWNRMFRIAARHADKLFDIPENTSRGADTNSLPKSMWRFVVGRHPPQSQRVSRRISSQSPPLQRCQIVGPNDRHGSGLPIDLIMKF
jgi:hypothetical protein